MIVKLLTEHHLEFLSFKGGGCTGSSTLVKMPHCWKSDVTGHIQITILVLLHKKHDEGTHWNYLAETR